MVWKLRIKALGTVQVAGMAAALTTMSALASAPVQAAEVRIEARAPVIELVVSEVMRAAPDIAQLSTGVTTQAMSAQEATRANSQAMAAVIERLRRMGIERKDIQTSNFSVSPRYRYDRGSEQQVFIGYEVSNNVQVRLRDLDRIGAVLDAMIAAGANNVSGIAFLLENDEAVKAEARRRAYARAQAMAEEYARIAGHSGVRIIEISESVTSQQPGPMPVMLRSMNAEVSAPPPIEQGEVASAVSLRIKYEMQ